jgi:carbamoyltransferase
MALVLGISAYYHDSAAALIQDGEIIAAAQEERYSRKKHDARFPSNAIQFCLTRANVSVDELDAVVFYDKPMLKFERLLETYLANAPFGFLSFMRAMPIWLKEKLYLKSLLRRELRELIHQSRASRNQTNIELEREKEKKPTLPELLFCEHHQSHAAAAFYPSPFHHAAILCLDGVGEWATSSAWIGEDNQIKPLFEIQFPHSLGLLYSAFTQYCGFKVNSGEYKLMGLAPYGEAKYVDLIKAHLVDIKEDGSFSLDMSYFDYAAGSTMTNTKFHQLFGHKAFDSEQTPVQMQMDLAKSIQVVTEDIVLKIADFIFQQTKIDNLCLAGGVALNCVSNGRLKREGPFKNIWIQPAAGDAGSAIGCAMQADYQFFSTKRSVTPNKDKMKGAYLGDTYATESVVKACEQKSLIYTLHDQHQVINKAIDYLEAGNVVGWFQGAMEFGPRALGNRSIIGDPRNSEMQAQMNLKIKQRESFRPFAPAVLAEDVSKWFEFTDESPYMLMVAEVKKEHRHEQAQSSTLTGLAKLNQIRSVVPAITHVDYSARVQTVHQDTNPLFHQLLSAFKQRTGVGMLINTSFNVRGEPPVRSPDDAIRCFLATEMDVLIMENVVLLKAQQPKEQIELAQSVQFEKD